MTGTGMPSRYPWPRKVNEAGISYTGRPPDKMYARPRRMLIEASVAIMGGIFT